MYHLFGKEESSKTINNPKEGTNTIAVEIRNVPIRNVFFARANFTILLAV